MVLERKEQVWCEPASAAYLSIGQLSIGNRALMNFSAYLAEPR
jgi:hypothetical protein